MADFDLAFVGYVAVAVVYALYALVLWRTGLLRRPVDRVAVCFFGAILASALWGGAAALADRYDGAYLPHLANGTDLLRYALWFGFLRLVLRPTQELAAPASPGARVLGAIAVALIAWGLLALAAEPVYAALDEAASRWRLVNALALPVFGLLLLEQVFRNQAEGSRWNAKPVTLALAFAFSYDIYLFAEAVMFKRFDDDALSVRGAIHALTAPLLFVASRRHAGWIGRLQVSRSAAFYSATLLLVGGYLLFIAGVGYYVRYFGGSWGRALQLALLFGAVLFLALLLFSGSLRARLRVFLGKNFFSYRYDYRQEWLRFTAMLSSTSSPQQVGELVVRGLADMVECPAGSLWSRTLGEDELAQTARWNMPALAERLAGDAPLARFMVDKEWILDLDEYRSHPRRYGDLLLPPWLSTHPSVWLVVPLIVGDALIGFVVLAKPRTALELNWEVRDLLKTAARQAAGYLAQMHATEALLEARKFDAFNRMSAFVVHDLKNIITQLSLMMKNARRLHDNPEFQQDMLLTVESSLEKMRQLMLQLREGEKPAGAASGVELAPLLQRIAEQARARGREVELELADPVATRGHDQRLERVIGHVVQNALDATPASGRVWVRLAQDAGRARIVVGDTGKGMSPEFVRTRLFRPFSTTKASGMGIGSYESFQYVKELGGSIDVASELGQGTVVTLLLPLFDLRKASDLQKAARQ